MFCSRTLGSSTQELNHQLSSFCRWLLLPAAPHKRPNMLVTCWRVCWAVLFTGQWSKQHHSSIPGIKSTQQSVRIFFSKASCCQVYTHICLTCINLLNALLTLQYMVGWYVFACVFSCSVLSSHNSYSASGEIPESPSKYRINVQLFSCILDPSRLICKSQRVWTGLSHMMNYPYCPQHVWNPGNERPCLGKHLIVIFTVLIYEFRKMLNQMFKFTGRVNTTAKGEIKYVNSINSRS